MTQCVSCGMEIPEGEGMVCRACEARNHIRKQQERQEHCCSTVCSGQCAGDKPKTASEEALKRCEELETLLFAFVWNHATFPLGQRLGKTWEEIADKTLETIEAAKKMVNIQKARERLLAARQRRENRDEVHTHEENHNRHF